MSLDVSSDQLIQIRVEGMHCHKCELALQRALSQLDGVREVEIDFNSKLASVLLDRNDIRVEELLNAVRATGYDVAGFSFPGSTSA